MEVYKLPKIHTNGNKLKSRWYIAYYFRHPETNKFLRHVVWISTKHKTVDARLKAIIQLKEFYSDKLKAGWSPYQAAEIRYTTLIEAFDYVVKIKCSSSRPQTIKTYKKVQSNFIGWLTKHNLRTVTLEQFNSRLAQEFCDYLKIERSLNNRSYNNYLLTLRTFYNDLIKREYTIYNPFNKVERLQIQAPEISPITKEELQLLSCHLQKNDPEMWLACQFVFYCFIRPNELTMMQPRYVNLDREEIMVPAHVSKNKIQQLVAIPEPFKKYLLSVNFSAIPQDHYIFSRGLLPGKSKISPERFSERFRKHCQKLGLDHRFYDLKHTGAGMAIDSGINVEDLRNQLRHFDLKVTTIYLKKFRSMAGSDLKKRFPDISPIETSLIPGEN